MPAVLTHDFFGRDLLEGRCGAFVSSLDERDAFLLGNQGPDPLFFLAVHPTLRSWRTLGSRMHKERTNELVAAMPAALEVLDADERAVGCAYLQGFLGHFALDSTVHPLVYSRQFALCDAGIDGLSRADGREVHAEIEREIDEMMLTAKRGQTVREYPAVDNTLEASPDVLATVQKLSAYLALAVYGQQLPAGLFASAVECYRITLGALHSPFGVKRLIASRAERSLRPHSFLGAMAHKAQLVHESWFANPERQAWICPFTGRTRTESFQDLYAFALDAAASAAERLRKGKLADEDIHAITHDVNFSGEPTVATLVVEG